MAAPTPVRRKFNPGTLQSDREVIDQFVVRHREFGILMDIVRHNVGGEVCQHTLVIAPRGRGKTMMLARVAAELRTSEALRSTFLPVRFMEESYEVFDAGEFWLDALFHLAPEVAPHDSEKAAELREAHAEFARRWRGRDLEEHARGVVLETAQRLGRKVVLMVENCQTLFENVDERFGWSLRKTLQTEPNVVFLGTATTRMTALEDVNAPFYEFFRPLLLAPLPLDECKTLWEAASGEARSEREIRPLQILTGGDPRLLVIIAGFARHRSLKELLEELVSLIDDHTEYFRSHLEGLGKTERRVYLALIDLWRPSTTAEIAARSRQEIRAVSSLLGRLVKRGAVAYEGKGQKRLYSVTQRLYSIYYKLRRQRDEAAVVQSLIHWMVACFTGNELTAIDEQLAKEAVQSAAIRDGFRLALGDMPAIRRMLPTVVSLVDPKEVYDLIVTALERAEGQDPVSALAPCEEVLRRFSEVEELSLYLAQALTIKGLVHQRTGNHDDAIVAYVDLVARFGEHPAPSLRALCCAGLKNKAAAEAAAGRPADAIDTCSLIDERYGTDHLEEVQQWVARALAYRGLAHALAGEEETAVAIWDKVLARFGGKRTRFHDAVAMALAAKAVHLARAGDATSALVVSADLAHRFGDSDDASVSNHVATAFIYTAEMQVQLRRPDEALDSLDRVADRFSTLLSAMNLQRIEWVRAGALLAKGERERALQTLRSAYDQLDLDEHTPSLLLRHVPELIGRGLTEPELLDVLTSDPSKYAKLMPIVEALRERIGVSNRTPIEVRELVQDVTARLDDAIERAKVQRSPDSQNPLRQAPRPTS